MAKLSIKANGVFRGNKIGLVRSQEPSFSKAGEPGNRLIWELIPEADIVVSCNDAASKAGLLQIPFIVATAAFHFRRFLF